MPMAKEERRDSVRVPKGVREILLFCNAIVFVVVSSLPKELYLFIAYLPLPV